MGSTAAPMCRCRAAPSCLNPPARLAMAYRALKDFDKALAASDEALAKAYGPRRLTILRTRAEIFIYPGFAFQVISGLLTNFHLPKSSLLMLVSAFAGRDAVRAAYREAVTERYRFYSYGDAMLVV